jgi:hypothetical protein
MMLKMKDIESFYHIHVNTIKTQTEYFCVSKLRAKQDNINSFKKWSLIETAINRTSNVATLDCKYKPQSFQKFLHSVVSEKWKTFALIFFRDDGRRSMAKRINLIALFGG